MACLNFYKNLKKEVIFNIFEIMKKIFSRIFVKFIQKMKVNMLIHLYQIKYI